MWNVVRECDCMLCVDMWEMRKMSENMILMVLVLYNNKLFYDKLFYFRQPNET